LRHLFDWCSDIVHQAYQPYAWQMSLALRRGGELLHTRSVPADQPWSIYNAVQIIDVEAMQAAYENHFLATYGHGTWRFTRLQPEALVLNWQPKMAFRSDTYRSVLNRPNLCQRIKLPIKNFLRRQR
jgi:D-alanyl-D-alanine carboxypeptidase